MSNLVLQSFDGEERADCFAKFVFLVSRDGWAAPPRGATGLSTVCDCGISWSYSLTIFPVSNIDLEIEIDLHGYLWFNEHG